jgi:hypothetical protein
MQLSSTLWLVIILVGAVLVAAGNLNFNIARDRERETAASEKAFSLLQVEIKNNLRRVAQLRTALNEGKVSQEPLETAAWTIVSNGGLLTRLDQTKMINLVEVYYLLNLAENYRNQMVDRAIGIQSALMESPKVMAQFQASLMKTLDSVEPKLTEILSANKK